MNHQLPSALLPVATRQLPDTSWHRVWSLPNHLENGLTLVELDASRRPRAQRHIDQFCTIYRTHLPILWEHEQYAQNTWYDQNGRIVFTTNRGLPGVGLDRKTFEAWQAALENGDPPPEEADTTRYTPPFETRDRETDMRHAYECLADHPLPGAART